MPLINCEINLILSWSANCFIIVNPTNNQEPTFALNDLVVTLSIQDNGNLLQQLNQVLKEQLTGININQKYQ